jgi:peptidoglycan DL-endopeptidase CwlO
MNPLLLLAILGVAAYVIWQQESCSCAPTGGSATSDPFSQDWCSNSAATPYVSALQTIGQQYGLPANLLPAVAYEESGFNPNAQNLLSGATGMFQLLPKYYPNAGQDWQQDAATAAQALQGYYSQFGDWTLALAAYNWGPGNVSNWQSNGAPSCALPNETSTYVANISGAVGLTGSLS